MKAHEILKAELRGVVVDSLLSGAFKLLPVTVLHELRVELSDKGKNDGHVLNAVVKEHESLILVDKLVLGSGGTALLGLHLLNEIGQVVSVNLFPTGTLPGIELHVDQSDEIPHLLEGDELITAVLQLLVGSTGQIEKTFQVVKVLSGFLELTSLIVEVRDSNVSVFDNSGRSLIHMEGTVVRELNAELLHFDREASKASLNVLSLLVLKRKNSFLDGTESSLRDIDELRLVVLEEHKVVIVHLDLMFLQEKNSLFHGLNLGKSLILNGLNITQVSHNLHEELLVLLSGVGIGNNLDAI